MTLPAWYVAEHTQHAYAITGHSAQGATVRWATVIGRPGDFTKNWAYTALSRAQLPTHMLVIDEPTPSQLERAETGPLETTNTDLLTRLEQRMKQRDDEDLAISQIDAAERRRLWEATLSPEAKRRVARTNRARQRQELIADAGAACIRSRRSSTTRSTSARFSPPAASPTFATESRSGRRTAEHLEAGGERICPPSSSTTSTAARARGRADGTRRRRT